MERRVCEIPIDHTIVGSSQSIIKQNKEEETCLRKW